LSDKGLFCKRSYLNTFGCLLQDPNLLDDIERPLDRTDFNTEAFYELLFVTIYNLHAQGCATIDEFSIDSYLSTYHEQYEIFQNNKGIEYLSSAKEMSSMDNYDYFYHRLRKYSLLRYYEDEGQDTRKIYDSTIVDVKTAEQEQQRFDNYTEVDIIGLTENSMVTIPSMKYCNSTLTTDCQAGSGLDELVDNLMKEPDVGIPLNSMALNTVTRGARKGCLYMRSCPQGGGKSRMAAGDACKFAVPYYYDLDQNKWVHTGISEPCLYITTEMTPDEIQTILIAIVSGVNEEHILYGEYEKGEIERVRLANQYIKSSPLFICHIPDFSIEDIQNIIKKYNRENGVEYFFFDYIHSSLRLMSEVNGKSGMGLKEHQLLLVFATELKTLCQQLNIFIFTASQLNGEANNATVKDQNLLSGAKALANKLDVGFICMPPTKAELKKVEVITHKIVACPVPNMCTWIYKIRRGRITRVVIWSYYDLGTIRVKDLFVTTVNFDLIDMDFTKIEHVEKVIEEHSIKIREVADEPVTEEENTTHYKLDF
jgi:replicative DNA helicase